MSKLSRSLTVKIFLWLSSSLTIAIGLLLVESQSVWAGITLSSAEGDFMDRITRRWVSPLQQSKPSEADNILFDTSFSQAFSNSASQLFTDVDDSPIFSFDDFTVLGDGWNLDRFIAFGTEGSDGSGQSENLNVVLNILSSPSVTTTPVFSFVGIQDENHNLVFDLQSLFLPAGTYWITAYVERPFEQGGQWFWYRTNPAAGLNGNDAVLQDPNDLSGAGFTSPTPFSKAFGAPSDLSFRIEGTNVRQQVQVPEADLNLELLAAGAAGIGWTLKKRRKRC